MQVRHLTDEEVQDYLDKNISENTIFIEAHLKQCGKCREVLQQYQNLYEELKDEPDIILPENLTQLVYSKLKAKAELKPEFTIFDLILGITGVGITLLTIFYYFDLNFMDELWKNVLSIRFQFDTTFFSSIKKDWIGRDGNLSLLLATSFVLFITYGIDHFILQHKLKRINQKLS